jgi:predicted cupin superfamily sugar epimerase
MEPADIIATLGLQPGGTCGYTASTFVAPFAVAPDDSRPPRPGGAALYFLVTPDHHVQLHAIASDQIYHYYAGDPLQVLMLADGTAREALVGRELAAGMRPQLEIPGRTYHTAHTTGSWTLMGTTSWPAVAAGEADVADAADLATRYPQAATLLDRYAGAAAAGGWRR